MIKKGIVLFILSIAIFYAINNYFIIQDNLPAPAHPDEARHLITSLRQYNILLRPSLNMFRQLLRAGEEYPPLFPLSGAILNIFLGTSRLASVMVNIIYFLLMLFSVYVIGKRLKDGTTGLLACFILSMFPMVFGMSRWFMYEFALTAIACFAIACLFYSEAFNSRKFSILFGLSLAIGMLTKWTFLFYIAGPFLYIALNREKKNFLNLTLAIIIGLLISLIWYVGFFEIARSRGGLIKSFSIANISPLEIEFPWYTLDGFLYYFKSIFFYQISPLFLILLLFTSLPFIKSRIKDKSILILWILTPYLILTFINNKTAHYIMPVLPAIALILSIGILSIPPRKLKNAVVCFVIISGLSQFLCASYISYRPMEKLINSTLMSLKLMKHPIFVQNMWDYASPLPHPSYRDRSRVINNDIAPYIRKTLSRKEDLFVGTVDCKYLSLDRDIEYLVLKNKWKNVKVMEFWREPYKFLDSLDKMDLLFVIHGDIPRLANEYNIERMLTHNNQYCSIKNFSKEDYKRIAEGFKGLYNGLEVVGIKRISVDAYISILVKQGRSYQETITQNKKDLYKHFLHLQEEEFSISGKSLELFSKDNTIKLYYQGKEVSAYKGLQASLRSNGIWYNSSDRISLWQVQRSEPNKITFTINWLNFPITQIWYLEIIEDKKVNWQVYIESKNEISLQDFQVSLFLSPKYQDWITPLKEGAFSNMHIGRQDWMDVVSSVVSNSLGVKTVKSREGILPAILFKLHQGKLVGALAQQDADHRLDVRVLLFRVPKPKPVRIFDRGRHKIFSGQIAIFENDKGSDLLLKQITHNR